MNKIEHLYTEAFGGYGAAQVKELKKSVEDTEMILVGDWSGGHEDKRRIDRIFGTWETLYRVKERLRNIRSIIERENLRRRRPKRLKMVTKMAMYGGGVAAAAAVILVCNFARKKKAWAWKQYEKMSVGRLVGWLDEIEKWYRGWIAECLHGWPG